MKENNRTNQAVKEDFKSLSTKALEELIIILRTARWIRKCKADDKDGFVMKIKCDTSEYEKNNQSLRGRHEVIFGGDYTYVASDDMVLSMEFTFIDNLEDNAWTELNLSWRQQVIKNIDDAQKTSIKSIQLQRILPGTNRDECAIYRVRCEKDKSKKPTWYFLNFDQLKDLLSGEEWMSGRMNTLSLIGSNLQVTLSLGSRKKDSWVLERKIVVPSRLTIKFLF